MGRSVSLFPRYNQRENLATNYVLLLFRVVYNESPTLFGRVLDALLELGISDEIGVRFEQQQRRGEGVPDGLILQSPFALHIETKISDWFYRDQLARHAAALKDESGRKILLALSGGDLDQLKFDNFKKDFAEVLPGVSLYARSFEQLLDAFKLVEAVPSLFAVLEEFREYCRDEGLTGTWKGWLDVVNAADSIDRNLRAHAYFCPATGGAYAHQRCEFLGLYSEKFVRYVGRIRACVDVDKSTGICQVVWKNGDEADAHLCNEAERLVREYRKDENVRAILVDDFVETRYEKTSRGGMQQSKRYFDVREAKSENAIALARWLDGKKWS